MSNSESQNRKGKGGRKPKFDYTSEEFLSLVESYAKKGFTDKEIAYAIGILPQTFCEKKRYWKNRFHPQNFFLPKVWKSLPREYGILSMSAEQF